MITKQYQKSKLEIGCGLKPHKGYVHLDKLQLPHVEIVHDINHPFPFNSNSFDEVLALDVVEHVDDILNLVEEIYRILKPNGIFELRTSLWLNPNSWRDITHKQKFTKASFDVFDKSTNYGKTYGFYTNCNFEILKRKYVGRFPCIDVYIVMKALKPNVELLANEGDTQNE